MSEDEGQPPEISVPASPDVERVPVSTIVVYAAPVGATLFSSFLITSFFMKFATDVLFIAPAIAGSIVLVGQVWDAVNDPPIGHLTDRTRTRWGRRRPWFFASALPLGACAVALWAPPAWLDDTQLVVWVLASFLLFRTFYSTFRVPHMALGAELARGYHDRTRVFGGAQLVETIGLLCAALTIGVVENAPDPRAAMASIALWMGAAIVSTVLIASLFMRERSDYQRPDAHGSYAVFAQILRNPHARLLLAIFLFDQAALAMVLGGLPYYSEWVVRTPGRTGVYMAGAVLSMLVAIPAWVALSRRFGKREVWLVSMFVRVLLLGGIGFVGPGDGGMMLGVTILIGSMAACGAVLGPSIKADIIDWDEARSGARREGAYFATWNFAQKSAGALGGWILGLSLAYWGYDATLSEQGPAAILGIRSTTGYLPALLHLVGMLCLWRFTLGEDEHRETLLRRSALRPDGRKEDR